MTSTGVISGNGGTGKNAGTPFATGVVGGGGGGGGGVPGVVVLEGNESLLVELNDVEVGTYSEAFAINHSGLNDQFSTSVRSIITIFADEDIDPDTLGATVTDDLDAALRDGLFIDEAETIDPDTLGATVTDEVLVEAEGSMSVAIQALGPVGYWKLDDAGSTFVDSSGNGYDGTGTAVTDQGQAGPDGNDYAVFVNASDSVITIPNPGADFSLPTEPGLSIVVLVRPTSTDPSLQLVTRGYQTPYTNGEWALQLGVSEEVLSVSSRNGNLSAVRSTTTSATFVVNEWRLLVVTFANGTTTGPIVVWSDGVDITSLNTTGTGASTALAGDLRIGGRPDASLSYDGAIAHVAVIPGVLDASAVADLVAAATADGFLP